MVEMENNFLPGVDTEVAQELEKAFKKQGIEVLTGTKYHGVEKFPGRVEVASITAVTSRLARQTKCLVAVGRAPLSADLRIRSARCRVGSWLHKSE